MNLLEAILLGLIQGLTEFLPVSSSGHLVLVGNLLGVQENNLLFDVMVHFGTLLAVFYVFKDDIINILKKPFQKITMLIILGSIPTAIIGFLFEDLFEKLFNSLLTVGFTLIITGTILWLGELLTSGKKSLDKVSRLDAFIIGIAQGAAITPGISRSGSTIAISLMLNIERKVAAKFSFLLSIPAILGATVLKTGEAFTTSESINFIPIIVGTVIAIISGYFAIKLLLKFLEQGKLIYFSIYCWSVGIIILLSYVI